MSDNNLSKIIIRKVRNKDEFCVKLGGKELHRFNLKEDALNFKREFEGKNRPSGAPEEEEPKKEEEKKKIKTGSVSLKK